MCDRFLGGEVFLPFLYPWAAPQKAHLHRVNQVVGLRPENCNFIKKETQAQVLSWEICEIFKNLILTEHLLTTASDVHSKDITA